MDRRDFLKKSFQVGGLAALYNLGLSRDEVSAMVNKYSGLQNETIAYLALPNPMYNPTLADSYIRAIKFGSGVVLSSLALNLSTVAGTLFLTNAPSDLRWLAGWSTPPKVTLNDGTNNATFYPLVAGTGETYSEKFLDTSFDDTTKWTKDAVTWTVSGGKANAADTANGVTIYQSVSQANTLYLYTIVCDSITHGKYKMQVGSYLGPAFGSTGTQTGYATAPNDTNHTAGIRTDSTGYPTLLATFTDALFQQVLTPSSAGFTYNNLTLGSLNPNAASYTMTITKI